MKGVGIYIEENLQEILGRFHAAVPRELGFTESALKLAAPILLQDIARAMRRDAPDPEPWRRAVVLVLSQPEGGVRGLLREFGLLRLALWETVAARGHAVPGEERRRIDRFLDEALAFAAERWAGLVRVLPPPRTAEAPRPSPLPTRPMAQATLARGPRALPTIAVPGGKPMKSATPPPLKAAKPKPPPLPVALPAASSDDVLESG